MIQHLERLREFLSIDLWREVPTPSRLKASGLHVVRVLTLSVRGFFADRCMLQATALAYVTLLSLVPLLAFAFSLAKGLGAQEQIRPVIIRWVAANQKEVVERIIGYIENTNVKALGTVGLLFLVWTTIKVLGTIEKSFNHIWSVQQSRSLFRKFTDYISVLVISPILLVVATSTSAALESSPVFRRVLATTLFGPLSRSLLVYAPTWVAFMAVYIFMPNTKVKLRYALVGGLVAGTAWQLAFWLYTAFQIGMARYNAIYGTFAALPVFMIWLYMSWGIVLAGAEVAWAAQNVGRYWEEQRTEGASFATREAVALRTMMALAVSFFRDGAPLSVDVISQRLKVSGRLVGTVIPILVEAKLCTEVVSPRGNAFQPARPLEHITPAEIVAAVRNHGDFVELRADGAEAAVTGELLDASCGVRRAALDKVTLRDLVGRVVESA